VRNGTKPLVQLLIWRFDTVGGVLFDRGLFTLAMASVYWILLELGIGAEESGAGKGLKIGARQISSTTQKKPGRRCGLRVA